MAGLVRSEAAANEIPSLQQASEERDCHDHGTHGPNGNRSTEGRLRYDAPEPSRDCSGSHALAVEARAECPVSVVVGKLEVVDRVSEPIAGETVGTKDWVIERHRQGRVIDPRCTPGVPGLMLDFVQGLQRPSGVAVEHLDPPLQSLAPR